MGLGGGTGGRGKRGEGGLPMMEREEVRGGEVVVRGGRWS